MRNKVGYIFLLLLIVTKICSAWNNTTDSIRQINLGEELFQRNLQDSALNSCVSCHFLNQSDIFVWGPSAYEVSLKLQDQSIEDFDMLFSDPFGSDVLMEAHMNYSFDSLELSALYNFLKQIPEPEIIDNESFNWHLLLVFITLILAFIVLLDTIFFNLISNKLIANLLLIFLLVPLLAFWIHDSRKIGLQEGYQPNQPMKFSHQLHIDSNQMDCRYCHSHAYNGKDGYLPSSNLCVHCHAMLREGSNTGEHELKKITNAYIKKKPLEWNKVHNLPDHVAFNHQTHIVNAKLDCKQCHGQIKNDHFAKQVEDFSMGWCLDCHRESNVCITDQSAKFKNILESINRSDSIEFERVGGEDCMTCHY